MSGPSETKPPPNVLERADEQEDDRVAAEEASEVAGEDEAVAEDAHEERIPV